MGPRTHPFLLWMDEHTLVDPVSTEVFRHLFISIAEEMGVTLERTAYSPNIKERRDHSCAIFDASGRLMAQAAHIPVHLGAFPLLMQTLVPRFRWRRGDVVICNDPFLGGTHLPDVSLVSPVFGPTGKRVGFVANRAHHADIGGTYPGSMGPTREVYQEGVIIPPLHLHRAGVANEALYELICRNVRTPDERRGDLAAQLAANATGVSRFEDLVAQYGAREVRRQGAALLARAETAVRSLLRTLPGGRFSFTDYLDDDGCGNGPLPIAVSLETVDECLRVDFTGTACQASGPINATLAVTHSAVYYALICLLGEDVPINQGAFTPVEIVAPAGTVVNASPPAAVAAGNVETSQRTVDAVLGAFARAMPERIPAASQGTMNNLTLGGMNPRSQEPWAYYETLGGGCGGSPIRDGASGVHCHMSNTRNTPVEALEYHYPIRIRRYALRDGSGGCGEFQGGCGVVREIELLADATVTLLSDRRTAGPYGVQGGQPGQPGANEVACGAGWEPFPAKASRALRAGNRLRISTPGGGGWGKSPSPEPVPISGPSLRDASSG